VLLLLRASGFSLESHLDLGGVLSVGPTGMTGAACHGASVQDCNQAMLQCLLPSPTSSDLSRGLSATKKKRDDVDAYRAGVSVARLTAGAYLTLQTSRRSLELGLRAVVLATEKALKASGSLKMNRTPDGLKSPGHGPVSL